jgi:hypothetical protein
VTTASFHIPVNYYSLIILPLATLQPEILREWLNKSQSNPGYVRCEFLTSVTVNSTILWYMLPYSPVVVHRRFGETYCSTLETKSNPRQKQVTRRRQEMLAGFRPSKWKQYVLLFYFIIIIIGGAVLSP